MANPLLEPVEGITLDQWAQANAKLASGGTTDEVIKGLSIDAPKWDRVNNEWLTRMSNDTSFTIATKYSAAFNQSATGNLGSGANCLWGWNAEQGSRSNGVRYANNLYSKSNISIGCGFGSRRNC